MKGTTGGYEGTREKDGTRVKKASEGTRQNGTTLGLEYEGTREKDGMREKSEGAGATGGYDGTLENDGTRENAGVAMWPKSEEAGTA